MKTAKHLIEYIMLQILFTAFRALPLDIASYVGGFMARSIGPFLSAHKIANDNITMIFPTMPREEKRILLTKMWDNLGRVAAEIPHLSGDALFNRIEIAGLENLSKDNKPVIFFSGHLGNWELSYPILHRNNIPVTLIYRQANNLHVDKLIARIRGNQSDDMFPKGAKGAIRMLRAVKSGKSLAMLMDQKMNEGISVPFFGRPAMTAPAIAELALRHNMPLIPARIVRTSGAHFKAMVYPPLEYIRTGDEEKDTLMIMTQINLLLEEWIREHPEQWFWVHRRWPKDAK